MLWCSRPRWSFSVMTQPHDFHHIRSKLSHVQLSMTLESHVETNAQFSPTVRCFPCHSHHFPDAFSFHSNRAVTRGLYEWTCATWRFNSSYQYSHVHSVTTLCSAIIRFSFSTRPCRLIQTELHFDSRVLWIRVSMNEPVRHDDQLSTFLKRYRFNDYVKCLRRRFVQIQLPISTHVCCE